MDVVQRYITDSRMEKFVIDEHHPLYSAAAISSRYRQTLHTIMRHNGAHDRFRRCVATFLRSVEPAADGTAAAFRFFSAAPSEEELHWRFAVVVFSKTITKDAAIDELRRCLAVARSVRALCNMRSPSPALH